MRSCRGATRPAARAPPHNPLTAAFPASHTYLPHTPTYLTHLPPSLVTQIDLGGDRVIPLLKFRGQVRPVIVAGSRSFVDKALKEADSSYLNLRDRAVSSERGAAGQGQGCRGRGGDGASCGGCVAGWRVGHGLRRGRSM